MPYRIAVLCYLFDERGRLLLLHRRKEPNCGLYSPIGGKLEMDLGESPAACALREIREEVLLDLDYSDIHLTGLVSETAFQGQTHWLIFIYEVVRPVQVQRTDFEEGTLEWHEFDTVERHLNVPETDRRIIYPLFRQYRGRFFHVHIDCTDGQYAWRLEYPRPDSHSHRRTSAR
ncbi:MAG: NUDIX domain-containing protein [Phycisphaerae bacterium]|nr:NUDIX domain-containing protein [Phycisphaerae bacterium]